MQALYRTGVTKRERSQKMNLSIYQSIYIPALTRGHGLSVVASLAKVHLHLSLSVDWIKGEKMYSDIKWANIKLDLLDQCGMKVKER